MFVWTLHDLVGASALAIVLLCGFCFCVYHAARWLWRKICSFFHLLYCIAVIVLFAGGCAVAPGPTPHVGLRNFENRDHCELKDVYIWYSLEWDQ